MPAVREYLTAEGRSPYREWFLGLNAEAAAKIAVAKERMAQGNASNSKSVGHGVFERKIDFGPGYRIYFGKDGEQLIILLGGGSKKRQQRDVAQAINRWEDYNLRKAQGEK